MLRQHHTPGQILLWLLQNRQVSQLHRHALLERSSTWRSAVAMAKVPRCDEDSNYRRDDAEQQATDHGGAVAAQTPRLVHLWEEASVEERFHERAVRKESDEGGNGAAEGAEQAAVRNWELGGGIRRHACSLTSGRRLHGWPG